MLFKSIRASLTVTVLVLTSTALSSDTAPVSELDMFYEASHAYSGTDNFVADAARILGGTLYYNQPSLSHTATGTSTYPSTAQSVQVRATDTTVSDLDIHIGLLPGLGLEFLPDHFSFASLRAKAHPTFELVIGAHGD
jgi:hypothetical protein